jgi:hypothetical protein
VLPFWGRSKGTVLCFLFGGEARGRFCASFLGNSELSLCNLASNQKNFLEKQGDGSVLPFWETVNCPYATLPLIKKFFLRFLFFCKFLKKFKKRSILSIYFLIFL